MLQDQIHPQEHRDRLIVNDLLNSQADDYKLVELARLLIRYQDFPGARKIYQDLNKNLATWLLTQEELFNGEPFKEYAGVGWMKRYLLKVVEHFQDISNTKFGKANPFSKKTG